MFSPLNIPDNWRASKCMPNSKYRVNKKKKFYPFSMLYITTNYLKCTQYPIQFSLFIGMIKSTKVTFIYKQK